MDDGPTDLANSNSNAEDTNNAMPVDNSVYDKKVVQWKLNLPQIGSYSCDYLFSSFNLQLYIFIFAVELPVSICLSLSVSVS